jgi:hypothetical protein
MIGEDSPSDLPRRRGRPPLHPMSAAVAALPPDETDSIPPQPKYREEDPRTRAARRAAELRNHIGIADDGVDKFFVDPRLIPDGWSYEWKTHLVLNQPNPSYEVSLARKGWEAVPVTRHPQMMPEGWKGNHIERDGQILMERPMEITQEAKDNELRKARLQVRQKEAQLTGAPSGQFERDNKGSPLVNVKKSYEAIPIPKD